MTAAVSVIIVNWNGEPFLGDCFQSLGAQSFRDFEVVFVDNASSDNSVALARELIPGLGFPVKVIELASNTGFTGGNIEGLRHCSGRYIALLNNDTAASEGWLEALVRAMDAHPEVGICASKLIVAGTEIIDSAGDGIYANLRTFKRGMGEPAASHDKEEYVFSACAGAALYRRQMIDEIGFLDDDFFLLAEDVDLGFRAQLAGWKALYVPQSVVQHKVGASIRKLSGAAIAHNVRNERILIAKNVPLSLLLKHLPLYMLEEIVFTIRHHLKSRTFRAYVRGNYEFIRALPRHLAKRKRIMRMRKVTDSYIESFLVPVLPFYREKLKMKAANMFHAQGPNRRSAVPEEPGPSPGKPRVAIGMPVYNGERHLRKALDSLLAQTYRHFLLHISDDASTDATAEICREYAGRDERVSYHRQQRNAGITANFNHALGYAGGSDYFMWAAQDDWWAPEYLERCLKAMESDSKIVCCSSGTIYVDATDQVVVTKDSDYSTSNFSPAGRIIHYLKNTALDSQIYCLIRTPALRGKRLINVIGQDYLFMVELLFEGDFRTTDGHLFTKRIRSGASGNLPRLARSYGVSSRWRMHWHRAIIFWKSLLLALRADSLGPASKLQLCLALPYVYLRYFFYDELTSHRIFTIAKKLAFIRGRRAGGESTLSTRVFIFLCLPLIYLRHYLSKLR